MLVTTILSALLASAPAAPSTPPVAAAGPAPAAALPVKPGDDKVVCEQEDETGSRLGGHKVCKTRRQWREDQFRDRMEIQGRQRRWDGQGG